MRPVAERYIQDVGEWPEHGDTGKDNRKHLLPWIPEKGALRGYSQPFFCAHHGSSALHGKESYEMGAWCLYSWETSRQCFFVDGLGRYGPAAKLQVGGSQMDSDAMLERLGGQSVPSGAVFRAPRHG